MKNGCRSKTRQNLLAFCLGQIPEGNLHTQVTIHLVECDECWKSVQEIEESVKRWRQQGIVDSTITSHLPKLSTSKQRPKR